MALRSDLLHKTSSLSACSELEDARGRVGEGQQAELKRMESLSSWRLLNEHSLKHRDTPSGIHVEKRKRKPRSGAQPAFSFVLRAPGAPWYTPLGVQIVNYCIGDLEYIHKVLSN